MNTNPVTDWPLLPSQFTPSQSVNYAARLFARLHDSRLRALGLNFGHVPVLASLAGGSALTQKALAHLARTEQPSMAQLLARMERDGLIERTPDPGDKRSSLISLTDAARTRLPGAHAALVQGNAEALAGFSAAEVDTLADLLGRLVANLERVTSGAPPGEGQGVV